MNKNDIDSNYYFLTTNNWNLEVPENYNRIFFIHDKFLPYYTPSKTNKTNLSRKNSTHFNTRNEFVMCFYIDNENDKLMLLLETGCNIYSNRVFYIPNKIIQNIKFKLRYRKYMKHFVDFEDWAKKVYDVEFSHTTKRKKVFWKFNSNKKLIEFLREYGSVLTDT